MISDESLKIYKIIHRLDNAPAIEHYEWNDSKNNPPEDEQIVLGADEKFPAECFMEIYTFRDGVFVDKDGFDYSCSEVTHWHPLPEFKINTKES